MMRYEFIDDIYTANRKIRDRFVSTVSQVSETEASTPPDGEGWSIQKIVEHVALVDYGTARICRKLVDGARGSGKLANGRIAISPEFWIRSSEMAGMKVEAPDLVQPTGTVSIADSLRRMAGTAEKLDLLRNDLEAYDLNEHKYPHPYFGPLTAAEWLAVAGGHELRHTKQIERLLKAVRQEKSPGQKEGDPAGVRTSNLS